MGREAEYAVRHPLILVIGGVLVGVPMVFFYAPPEFKLPLFKSRKTESELNEDVSLPPSETSTRPTSPSPKPVAA